MRTVEITTSGISRYCGKNQISQRTFGYMTYNGSYTYYNARYKFHTPSGKVTKVTLHSNPYDTNNWHINLAADTSGTMVINYLITKDGETPAGKGGSTADKTGTMTITKTGGTDKKTNSTYKLSGTADVELEPDTDYYLWIFVGNKYYVYYILYSTSFTIEAECEDGGFVVLVANGKFVKAIPVVTDGNSHFVKLLPVITDGSGHWVKTGG